MKRKSASERKPAPIHFLRWMRRNGMPLILHPCASTKPEPFVTVRLVFSNGLVQPGYWTGEGWVIHGRIADPVSWGI